MGNNQNKTSKSTATAVSSVTRTSPEPAVKAPSSSHRHSVKPASASAEKLDYGFNFALISLPGSRKTTLVEEDFSNHIFSAIPGVGKFIYQYMLSLHSSENSIVPIDKFTYIRGGTAILSLSSVEDRINFYVSLFASGKDIISFADVNTLLMASQQTGWMSAGLNISPAELSVDHLKAITSGLFKSQSTSVPVSEVSNWSIKLCPKLTECLHAYTCSCLVGNKEHFAGKETLNEFVKMLREGYSVVSLSSVWMLTYLLPPKYFPCITLTNVMPLQNLITVVQHNAWHSLYSSNIHGLSVSRFQHLIMDYLGPTLLFIKFDQYVYAVAVDTQWMESSRHWGGGDGMFFEIQPNYRLIQSGEDIMYLNLSDRAASKGIHIGKTARTTFLKVDDEFNKVSHYGVDFKLDAIEVWGCGGEECLHQLGKQKQWEHKEITKHQNRKLTPDEWKENPDRAILEMGGVTTEHSERMDI